MQDLDYLKLIDAKLDLESISNLKSIKDKAWTKGHGPEYLEVLSSLPQIETNLEIESHQITLDTQQEINDADFIKEQALKLKFWKKGPFNFYNKFTIDAEWRSDLKWNRVDHLFDSFEDEVILDIGCNNGYFMFAMTKYNPKLVLGIDPYLNYAAQFHFVNHFAGKENLKFELFGFQDLPLFPNSFDRIFSMGVLYHHRHPLEMLINIRNSLKSGGQLILETIGIPGNENYSFTPPDRYANMGNVWFLPTLNCLVTWLEKCKFVDIEVISTEWQGVEEQRITEWTSFRSYKDYLDQNNPNKTSEGHFAPERFIVVANKR